MAAEVEPPFGPEIDQKPVGSLTLVPAGAVVAVGAVTVGGVTAWMLCAINALHVSASVVPVWPLPGQDSPAQALAANGTIVALTSATMAATLRAVP